MEPSLKLVGGLVCHVLYCDTMIKKFEKYCDIDFWSYRPALVSHI